MNDVRWFDSTDSSERHLEGRFLDIDVPDPAATAANPRGEEITKKALALEVRVRSVNGQGGSTCARVKDDNREAFQQRFPAAWAHYHAVRAGNRVEPEQATALSTELVTRAQISHLVLHGYGTVERLARMTDTEALQYLGNPGINIRDLAKATVKAGPTPAPKPRPETPLTVSGPLDALTIEFLSDRGIVTLEQIRSVPSGEAAAMLGPRAFELMEFANATLDRKATPIDVPGYLKARGIESVDAGAELVADAVRRSAKKPAKAAKK